VSTDVSTDLRSSRGNAIIEFVVVCLLLFIPLVMGATAFSVLHTAEAAMQAAVREGARAYTLSGTHADGTRATQVAAQMAASSHGITGAHVVVRCLKECEDLDGQLAGRVEVTAQVRVALGWGWDRTARAAHVMTVRLPS
jgi:Flp pilus assembly protein TadG